MTWACFMVYWILRQAHLKDVGLPQNQETMTLQISQPLIYCYLLCRRAQMNRMVMRAQSRISFHLKAHAHMKFNSNFPGKVFRWVSRALIISWSWPLAIEESGPKYNNKRSPHTNVRIDSHRCLGTFGSRELGRLLEDDEISQTHLHEYKDSHPRKSIFLWERKCISNSFRPKHTNGTSWGNPYPYSPVYTSGSYCSARTWHPTVYNAQCFLCQ